LGPDAAGTAGLRPSFFIAFWAGLLGLYAVISAGFGNYAFAVGLAAFAAAVIFVFAGAVWLAQRFRPGRPELRLPARLGGVFLLAVTVTVACLALAFGPFMLMIAVLPFAAAIRLEILARRNAASAKAGA